jgi:hypothetical protein
MIVSTGIVENLIGQLGALTQHLLGSNPEALQKIGYPSITTGFIIEFNLVRFAYAADDPDLANKDCETEMHKYTDEAYGMVLNAYNKLRWLRDKDPSLTRKQIIDVNITIKNYFKITSENTNDVINKLIEVSQNVLLGDAGLKSVKVEYAHSINPFGFANTLPTSWTTNLTTGAITDLIINDKGYFHHTLIHETIHRVFKSGFGFASLDVYEGDDEFSGLLLEQQLVNPDSYTCLFKHLDQLLW